MANILAIDDDKEILKVIKTALEREGHHVDTSFSVQEVSDQRAKFCDLILLDIMMPGEDGFSYCRRIRDMVDCPIVFLTARTGERDLVHGLGIGADDYIQKPFSIAELRARVAAHLRREFRPHSHTIRIDDFLLNLTEKQIYYENAPIVLTKSQYAICALLMEYAGQVFSKEQIYEAVFGYDKESDISIITEHVKNIRGKLRTLGAEPIETVWGVGYRWKREK